MRLTGGPDEHSACHPPPSGRRRDSRAQLHAGLAVRTGVGVAEVFARRCGRDRRTCRIPGERSADMSTLGQLIGVLFVVGLIIRYFWWIALVIIAAIAYKRAPVWWARYQAAQAAERARLAAIIARADQQ